MKKATRILALVLAIVMCIGCLAACGSSSNSGTTTAARPPGCSVSIICCIKHNCLLLVG